MNRYYGRIAGGALLVLLATVAGYYVVSGASKTLTPMELTAKQIARANEVRLELEKSPVQPNDIIVFEHDGLYLVRGGSTPVYINLRRPFGSGNLHNNRMIDTRSDYHLFDVAEIVRTNTHKHDEYHKLIYGRPR